MSDKSTSRQPRKSGSAASKSTQPSKKPSQSQAEEPAQNPFQGAGQHAQQAFKKLPGLSSSPGVKFFIIGVITLLLLVPSLLVWGLVEERADRAETVARSIAQGWGDQQAINGPYLVVPYTIEERSKKDVNLFTTVVRHAIFSPASTSMEADVTVEERKKSIYSVPLFHLKSNLKGRIDEPDLSSIVDSGGTPDLNKSFLAIGISDSAGFRSEVMIKMGNAPAEPFRPGLSGLANTATHNLNGSIRPNGTKFRGRSGGIHFDLNREQIRNGFDFEIDMALNGSRNLAVIPNAKNTKLKIKSNWPHPGFDGRFLPETRDITDEGFTAQWTVPDLARGIDAVWLSSSLPFTGSNMQINFVEPLKFYQVVSRTLKYSIAFFALIFLAVFILELMGKRAIHWIQYILVGLAMVVFYIVLLAFAEHVGFTIAYIISATATTVLVAWYVGDSLGQRHSVWIMGAIMGILYTIIFLILKEQEYALLAGSIIAFLAIAATMVLTRSVDWSGQKGSQGEETA